MLAKSSDVFYEELCALIKEFRLRKNITLARMAEHLKLTKATVSNMELGRQKPSVYQVLLIADLLEMSYTDLIPSEKDPVLMQTSNVKDAIKKDNVITDDQKGMDKTTKNVLFDFLRSVEK